MKTIGVWIVVIAIIAIGLFVILKGPLASTPAAQNITGTTTTSGQTASSTSQVQAQEVSVGTGALAAPGSIVSVLYVGYIGTISTSTIFDSSAAHGNAPLRFALGAQGLIPGFQIGVNGMKEGGERLMAIPPTLGYGGQDFKDPQSGRVIVPANSTLIFDVKLVKVEKATSTPATQTTTP